MLSEERAPRPAALFRSRSIPIVTQPLAQYRRAKKRGAGKLPGSFYRIRLARCALASREKLTKTRDSRLGTRDYLLSATDGNGPAPKSRRLFAAVRAARAAG